MAPPKKMSKRVTQKENESGRISLPARVRDHLFPHVAQNTKTAAKMVDEKGDSYDVVLKVRHNRTKPEIMAKGGKKFAQKRKLKPVDVLVFSRGQSGDHFKVRVKRGPSLAGFSARGSKPLASTVPAYDHASMETLVLGLGGPLAAGSQTSVPYLIGSDDHATVALGLGSLSAQAQPPPVALRLSLSIGSDIAPVVQPPPRTDTELRLRGFTASTVPAFGQYLIGSDDDASSVIGSPSMETLVLGLGGPLAAGSQTSAPAFSQSLIGSDDHATNVPLFSQCLIGSDIAPRTDTELRLGGFSARGPQPLASTVPAYDHAASMETLVLGLGGPLADGSQTSVPTFGPYLIGSDDHATVALGLGSLSGKAQPPPVALRLNLRLSIGSDDMPVEKPPATTVLELSLSNGSNHAPPIKPRPAPHVSSSVGRIKAEVEEEGVGVGPTLELTLGVEPPEGIWVAEQELQEPKPPTGLIHFGALFVSLNPAQAAVAADQHACIYPF